MCNFKHLLYLFLLIFTIQNQLVAQKLLIINGGLFSGGAADYSNVAIYNLANQTYTVIDTIFVNSVQDVYIENDSFAYVAAQDSIVKYNLITETRVAATRFNSVSTVRLKVWNNTLLVGNFYGSADNNLRLFNKNTLVYLDSIPEISKAAKDFLIINDTAYISQNTNDASTNFDDANGYLALVDLVNSSFVRNETLNTQGYDLGRLVQIDNQIVAVNSVSNSLSYYNTQNPNQKSTVLATQSTDLQATTINVSIYKDTANNYFIPFNNSIGIYNITTNDIVQSNLIAHNQTIPFSTAFAYCVDSLDKTFFLTKIFYNNQSANYGVVYDRVGDSIATFPVGYSPEVIAIFNNIRTINVNEYNTEKVVLKVYPNPTTDFINVSIEDVNIVGKNWNLYNSEGKIVVSGKATNLFNIELSNIVAGIYWLQIERHKTLHAIIKN